MRGKSLSYHILPPPAKYFIKFYSNKVFFLKSFPWSSLYSGAGNRFYAISHRNQTLSHLLVVSLVHTNAMNDFSFIHSSIHSSIYSSIHSFIHSFIGLAIARKKVNWHIRKLHMYHSGGFQKNNYSNFPHLPCRQFNIIKYFSVRNQSPRVRNENNLTKKEKQQHFFEEDKLFEIFPNRLVFRFETCLQAQSTYPKVYASSKTLFCIAHNRTLYHIVDVYFGKTFSI